MFTGLVECMGEVQQLLRQPPGVRLVVDAGVVAEGASLGDSVAINGCCLTVVDINSSLLSFDAGTETLSRTNLGRLQTTSRINLERSLKANDRLGGHFVTGHVDAVGNLEKRVDDGDWSHLWFHMPPRLGLQMVSKGSVAVDGVSLTLVDVEDERFSVALIPHTLDVTTLGNLQVGDQVNLETDLLAKYVEKQLAGRDDSPPQSPA